MRKILSATRNTPGCILLCLTAMLFLPACTTTDPQSVTRFKQGISSVQTDSQAILLKFNSFVREAQLSRVADLPNLKESDVAPGLDAGSVASWNQALEALFLYASALEVLANPAEAAKVGESLKSLGARVIALSPPKDPNVPGSDELNKAVSHIGEYLVAATAQRKALTIARAVDPNVRIALAQMADMVGSGPMTGGLRTTLWSNWTTHADEIRRGFLTTNDKRAVAVRYAEALEGRQTSDLALGALRKALLDLADLHTAVAQGRSADAAEIIGFLRQEVAFAKQLLDSAQVSKPQ
jgi:hypothetical protein